MSLYVILLDYKASHLAETIMTNKIIPSIGTVFEQEARPESGLTPRNVQVLFKAALCKLMLTTVFQAASKYST